MAADATNKLTVVALKQDATRMQVLKYSLLSAKQ
jgi:hypothetical protein